MTPIPPIDLRSTFLRARADATVEALPVDATFWQRLSAGELGSFAGERMVSIHRWDAPWSGWEMHPAGDEIVCLISGRAVFVIERDGGQVRCELETPGQCVVVPRGAWHTAQADGPCEALFVTPGEGTLHRAAPPREKAPS